MGTADVQDPTGWSRTANWRPSEVDIERAGAARMHDYHLGSSYDFEVDRGKAQAVPRPSATHLRRSLSTR